MIILYLKISNIYMDKLHEIQKLYENKIKNEKDINAVFRLYNVYIYNINKISPIKGLEISEEAISLAKKLKNEFQYHVMLYNKALSYAEQEDYEEALKLFYSVKIYFQLNNQQEYYLAALSNIGVIFYELKKYKQSLYIWKNNIVNFSQKSNIKHKFVIINNLISVYLKTYKPAENIQNQLNEIIEYYKNNEKDQIYFDASINFSKLLLIQKDFEKSMAFAEECLTYSIKEANHKLQINAYFCLIDIYKAKKDDVNTLKYLKLNLIIIEKFDQKFQLEDIYKELYLFHKSKRKYREALNFLEKFYHRKDKRKAIILNLNNLIEKFSLNIQNNKESNSIEKYLKSNIAFVENSYFFENKNGALIKINIDNIVYIEAVDKMTKIIFSDATSEVFKISFKEFLNQFELNYTKKHLLFHLNKRSLIVNLYWLNKFDKYKKTIQLNVFGNHYLFNISRNQFKPLKDFLHNM